MEVQGIPTVTLTRTDFVGVMKNAVAGLGLAPDAAMNGATAWIEIDASAAVRESPRLDPWPITARPENLVLLVAGGGHPTNSYWLQGYSPRVVGREIHLPGS